MKPDIDVYVPFELPKQLRQYFSYEYILNKPSMSAEEKIGYLKALEDIQTFLKAHMKI